MVTKTKRTLKQPYNPLILQCNRLMEAFAKANDERSYYLDKQEGFLLYADLDKNQEALDILAKELDAHSERYLLIPKMTFYEAKKLMENFVHEKVYDVDTKERILDLIQTREPREQFLEFIYDHHTELEKWQQYYHERARIRIIEWLRRFELHFVFEEDLDLTKNLIEKLKKHFFDGKVPKEVSAARKVLEQKAKVYYSSEALNPRPKRGRPPKQQQKVEVEPQITCDIYTTVPATVHTFLFTPDISHPSKVSFSAKYDSEEEFLASMRGQARTPQDAQLDSLNQKLEALRKLASGGGFESEALENETEPALPSLPTSSEEDDVDDILDLLELSGLPKKAPPPKKKAAVKKALAKKAPAKKAPAKKAPAKKAPAKKAPAKKAAARKVAKKKPAKKK